MIVGKYAVNPNHVSYASRRFDSDTGKVELCMYLDDGTPLCQWIGKDDEVDRLFKLADSACCAAEDAEIAALTNEGE